MVRGVVGVSVWRNRQQNVAAYGKEETGSARNPRRTVYGEE